MKSKSQPAVDLSDPAVIPSSPASSSDEEELHSIKTNRKPSPARRLCYGILDVLLLAVLLSASSVFMARHLYQGPLTKLVEALKRNEEVDERGYFPEYDPQITYYGRQCGKEDISTTQANDLLVPKNATSAQATDIMMEHGAVVIQDLLSKQTATELRNYLETRHAIQSELPWHEKFWESISRLSLGLGTRDDSSITKALEEVGNHPVLRRTLEGIVGPDAAIVEISTLTTMYQAEEQGMLCWFLSVAHSDKSLT